MSERKLRCIFGGCKEEAWGMILVNDKAESITMMFLPACQEHGKQMKTAPSTITLDPLEDPVANLISSVGPRVESDVTLVFEVFE